MIWKIVVVVLVLWGLGLLFSYTFGGLLHLLLVVLAAALIARLFADGQRID